VWRAHRVPGFPEGDQLVIEESGCWFKLVVDRRVNDGLWREELDSRAFRKTTVVARVLLVLVHEGI
jgi:hypothetical protein